MNSSDQPAGLVSSMLRAFRYRNYRLYFVGQILSLTGTWITTVATSWLVYQLARQSAVDDPESHAALILGVVSFASQIPIFLLAPLAGVWADRLNLHRVLIVTQVLSMIQSFAMAWLTLSGLITIPQIILLSICQGLINAWDMPVRQSFVVQLVEKREDLGNAIALSSSMVHGARLIGPAIAGALIYYFNEGICFLVDGISFFAVLLGLLAMKITAPPRPATRKAAWSEFRDGAGYAFGFAPARALLVLVAMTSLVAMTQPVLMPIYADVIIGGGSRTLGFLLGASGLGAFLGSLYLASRKTVVGLGKLAIIANGVLGLCLLAFSTVNRIEFALPVLMVTGGAMVIEMASCNTLLQTLVPDEKRGRVMSLFTMAFFGMAPFGSLLAGALASRIGAPGTLAAAGALCLVFAAFYFFVILPRLRPLVRAVYVEKGILPEVAQAIHQTALDTTAAQE